MDRLRCRVVLIPFAAVVRCTADPAKADKRTRSKWSRVMRYAAVYKPVSEPLDHFIRRRGGINACAARFARWPGARLKGVAQRTSQKSLLRRFPVRRHQSEVVFGVLVVVLRRNDVPRPRFFLG
jgi:hypothetical protein